MAENMSAYLATRSADFPGEGALVVTCIFRYYWKYGLRQEEELALRARGDHDSPIWECIQSLAEVRVTLISWLVVAKTSWQLDIRNSLTIHPIKA
jgi:hypothetical protein